MKIEALSEYKLTMSQSELIAIIRLVSENHDTLPESWGAAELNNQLSNYAQHLKIEVAA